MLLLGLAAPRAEAQQVKARPAAKAQKVRQAKEKHRYQRTSALSQANRLRLRADKISRIVSLATTSKHARRYVTTRFRRDLNGLIESMTALQREGELPSGQEARSFAAVARILHAASILDRRVLQTEQQDQVEVGMSIANYRRRAPHHETAVEIETELTEAIMASITTKDPKGSVAPLLEEGGKPAPDFLVAKATASKIQPHQVQWDTLTIPEKHALIVAQSEGRSFSLDRNVPGVRFRTAITVSKDMRVAGRDLKKGETIPVSRSLLPKVEYMAATAVKNFAGVEFHTRKPGRASLTASAAFTIDEIFGSDAGFGHQHVPVQIPSQVRKGNHVSRASLVDFYRRTNMAAELKCILDGFAISSVRSGSITYFDFLKSKSLGQLNKHLHQMAATNVPRLAHNTLKMAAVGFRTGRLYGDSNMMGFEVRTLSQKDSNHGALVDAVQKGLLTQSYGLSKNTMKRWQERHVAASPKEENFLGAQSQVLADLHYNKPIAELLKDAAPKLKPLLEGRLKELMFEHAETYYGLKMLVHDWSKDPALYGDPVTQKLILKSQKRALQSIASGASPNSITRWFVKTSGLHTVFAESIGMKTSQLRFTKRNL